MSKASGSAAFRSRCCHTPSIQLCYATWTGYQWPSHHKSMPRYFSTAPQESTEEGISQETNEADKEVLTATSLRRMVKPFLLKCHPDVVFSKGASDSVKQTNLQAIQSLNQYLDMIKHMVATANREPGKPFRYPSSDISEIEFILYTEDVTKKGRKKKDLSMIMSRRNVELLLPSKSLMERGEDEQLILFAKDQLSRLLHVAGLKVPKPKPRPSKAQEENTTSSSKLRQDGDREFSQRSFEANQRAFVSKIDWQKVDEMHEQALKDREADIVTQGLFVDNLHGKRKLIAHTLSQLQVQREGLTMLEELIAIRRMSLILEENFEELELDDLASFWWSRCTMILTKPRPYNTSSSAIYKRIQRGDGDNGFRVTFHADKRITMTIPSDFRDDELVDEFKRNIWEFEQFIGDGLDDIFFEGAVPT